MLPDIKPLDLLISSDMGSSSRARDWPRRTDKKTNFASFQLQPWAYLAPYRFSTVDLSGVSHMGNRDIRGRRSVEDAARRSFNL